MSKWIMQTGLYRYQAAVKRLGFRVRIGLGRQPARSQLVQRTIALQPAQSGIDRIEQAGRVGGHHHDIRVGDERFAPRRSVPLRAGGAPG